MIDTTTSLLVGFDFNHETDTGVLIVARKRPNETLDIINAFQGEEARELFERLAVKKEVAGNAVNNL